MVCLATFRLTYFMTNDRGPFRVLERLRAKLAGWHPEVGELLSCTWCSSVWAASIVSLPCLFAHGLSAYLLSVLAASGFVVLVEEALLHGQS